MIICVTVIRVGQNLGQENDDRRMRITIMIDDLDQSHLGRPTVWPTGQGDSEEGNKEEFQEKDEGKMSKSARMMYQDLDQDEFDLRVKAKC